MVRISDFHTGDKVYIADLKSGRNIAASIYETEVAKVGRKYLTDTSGYRYEEAASGKERFGLVRELSWGRGYEIVCCRTRKDAEELLEWKQLQIWLSKVAEPIRRKSYTLEQLRQVKEILEPELE